MIWKTIDKLSGEWMKSYDTETNTEMNRLGEESHWERTHTLDADGYLVSLSTGEREMDTHWDGSVSDMLGNTLFYLKGEDDN